MNNWYGLQCDLFGNVETGVKVQRHTKDTFTIQINEGFHKASITLTKKDGQALASWLNRFCERGNDERI